MQGDVKHRSPHTTFPLRKITRVETQQGASVVVMACGHATAGRPESLRYSRYFPCAVCHELVLRARAEHKARSSSEQ
jgi:hypothetical protein